MNLPVCPKRHSYKEISGENPKLLKTSKKMGVVATALHLAPSDLSGTNVCPYADLCRDACLHTAGSPAFMRGKTKGRIRRTQALLSHSPQFETDYITDLCLQAMKATEAGLPIVHRPNATSDLRWESISFSCFGGKTLFELFPEIQFMDYTKIPMQMRAAPANYHLTFSLSGSAPNAIRARQALGSGYNITAVFAVRRGQPLPKTFWGLPVIDGDEHDLRYLDPPGHVVGLRAKGRAIGDCSGFVMNPYTGTNITRHEEWIEIDPAFTSFEFALSHPLISIDLPSYTYAAAA